MEEISLLLLGDNLSQLEVGRYSNQKINCATDDKL